MATKNTPDRPACTDYSRATTARRSSSFMQFKVLLSKDIKQEFRTKDMLVSMCVYALLVIIVFGVALSFTHPGDDYLEINGGLLWSLIIFTSLLGLNRSFSRETQNACLEGLLLTPLDRGTIFLAKATSNLLLLLLVEIIAIPLYWFFFSSSIGACPDVWLTILPFILGSIGIAGTGTLLSTITSGVHGRDVMLALLFIPIIFPLLYACVSATAAILGGEALDALIVPLALAGGYDIVMILVSWVLYDFVVG